MKIKLFVFLFCIAFSANAENLFNEATYKPLVADRKASRIGDLVTLVIVETSKAESTAGSGVNRDLNITLSAYDTTRAPGAGLNFERGSDVDAGTARRGFLQAQISVVIADITENGNYHVEGKQVLRINNEEQIITLKGLLRPEDITNDNIALSNRLANASIQFSGEGMVGDEQRKGLIETILGWLGII